MSLARSVTCAALALGCIVAALSLATDESSDASDTGRPDTTQVFCLSGASTAVDSAKHVVVSTEIAPVQLVVVRPGTVRARVEVTRRVRVDATVTATMGGCPGMRTPRSTVTITDTAERAGTAARRWMSTRPTTAQARREAVRSATHRARESATKLARANALQVVLDEAVLAAQAASWGSSGDVGAPGGDGTSGLRPAELGSLSFSP